MINKLTIFKAVTGMKIANQWPISKDLAYMDLGIGCDSFISKTPDKRSLLIPSKDIKTAPNVAPKTIIAVETNINLYAESIAISDGRFTLGSDKPHVENNMNIASNGQITNILPAEMRCFIIS